MPLNEASTIVLHFVSVEGNRQSAEAKPGTSLMQAAVAANIAGIEADCGGLLTCATCHVYVREPFGSLLPPPDAEELAMLEFIAAERKPQSRLSCQLQLTLALDGLTVDLPDRQH